MAASPHLTPVESLSIAEARQIALRAQGLTRRRDAPRNAAEVLRTTSAVQLDTISVLARSHELVAYARIGAAPRASVEEAYWGAHVPAFEYSGHATCIMPVEMWPYFSFRRRAMMRKWGKLAKSGAMIEARARLKDGPLTASDLGGARAGDGGWWNWSDAKRAIEMLHRFGEAVVVTRRGWKRVYDLPGRVLPRELLAHEPTDEECHRHLVARAARALGVATRRDIIRYFMLTAGYLGAAPNARDLIDTAIDEAGLTPVRVEGWRDPAYAHPDVMTPVRGEKQRTVLLSPFDSLIWERERTLRLFDFAYQLEAYTPKHKRVHGYFTMPLLAEGRLAGRVDPAREGATLVARSLSLEDPTALDAMGSALREAATWVGCDAVRIDVATPARVKRDLQRAVS
jgi:uncharacterized protein YcaQ